jgi:probable phosphoglycerate mutase
VGAQGVDRAVSSDLVRARETATLVGFPDAAADPAWREVDVGEWAGRLAMDVVAEDEAAYRAWREGREAAPGGEAYPDFAARIERAGRALLDGGGEEETILVVCHGGAVRTLCVGLLGLELRQLGGVGNGSATVIEAAASAIRLAAYNVGGAGGEVL